LKISRLDLDGLGSPRAIAARIHQLESDLPKAVPVEALCHALDIAAIDEIETAGFEAALIMDVNKAAGGILVAAGRSRQRRRYSIAHELGHFLIPTHMPEPGDGFTCSLDDLHRLDPRERNRRQRIEAEANAFAAALLMPAARIRTGIGSHAPNLSHIIELAYEFDVSKEALARAYVDAHREAVAVIILQHGRVARIYRDPEIFPWVVPRIGATAPTGSISTGAALAAGDLSDIDECEPEIWFGERDAKRVNLLTEQLLGQQNGYAMLLLHAQFIEADETDDAATQDWR
jgi:hypothetical protein